MIQRGGHRDPCGATIAEEMRFAITAVDYAPDELHAQVPLGGIILRQLPGADRRDYYLAELDRPLLWKNDGCIISISHLVLGPRWVGGVLAPTMCSMPVNIAYVIDQSVLSDSKLDFGKCSNVATGIADGVELRQPTRQS